MLIYILNTKLIQGEVMYDEGMLDLELGGKQSTDYC